MSNTDLRMHFHPASYNSRRALAVAFHVDAPVEVVICDLMSGAQGSPAFRALNPNGLVPVLEDGDFVLWESMAITQYLADKYPSSVWPNDARVRADITRWQGWDLAHFGRAADVLLFENRLRGMFGLGAPNEVAVAQAEAAFTKHAQVLDTHLTSRTHVLGDTLTLADFALAGTFGSATYAGAPVTGFANVARWYDLIRALPAWERVSKV
jgi:glutathione S-transferase